MRNNFPREANTCAHTHVHIPEMIVFGRGLKNVTAETKENVTLRIEMRMLWQFDCGNDQQLLLKPFRIDFGNLSVKRFFFFFPFFIYIFITGNINFVTHIYETILQ